MFTNPICHWAPSGPNLLFEADFTEPVTQPFPQSSAEMTALGLPAPTAIYDFNEASGNVLDHVGSNNLTPVNSPMQNQKAIGLWTGSSLASKRAIEFFDGSNASVDAANNTIFDIDATTSIAILCVFRGTAGATRQLFGKRSITDPGVPGYHVILTNTGWLQTILDDGPNAASSFFAANHNDRAWHCVLFVVDRNIQNMGLWSDLGADAVTAIGGIGSPTNTDIYAVGNQYNLAPAVQVAYMAVWLGANAEGMNQTDLDNFWVHATDPTGLLTTAQHTSLISDVIGEDSGGLGTLLGEFSPGTSYDQIPIGYNAGLSNPNSMGLRSIRARSTLLTDSDDLTVAGWLKTNVTVSGAAADLNDSPRGLREANKVTATAAFGYTEMQFASVAGQTYTLDVFVKRHSSMATDVAGRLIFRNVTGGATVTNLPFTATDEWQRLTLKSTAQAGQVLSALRVRVDVNGEHLCVFRATAVNGVEGVPIFASGGVATTALTDYQVAGIAGQYLVGPAGEIRSVGIRDEPNVIGAVIYHNMCDFALPGSNNDRHGLYYQGPGAQPVCLIRDNAGVLVDATTLGATDFSNEHDFAVQWDSVNPIAAGRYSFLWLDAVRTNGAAVAGWTDGSQTTTVYIGQARTLANQWDGLIATVRSWDGPNQ